MKFLSIFLLLLIQTAHAQSSISKADEVLSRVAEKLNGLKWISYDAGRELSYASENYHHQSAWTIFCDFTSKDTLTGFRYQIDDTLSKQVFNGTEAFDINKKDKSMQVTDRPSKQSMKSLSAFYNSIVTLRNGIPLLLADKETIKEVRDSSVGNRWYYVVSVNIGKRRIQNLGNGFDAMQTSSRFIYRIIVEKQTYLPVAVVQENDLNTDFIRTSFDKIQVDSPIPPEASWYYSTYAGEYKKAATAAALQLLATGVQSPDWKLAVYNKNNMLSLDDFKGKVVVIDFWIKNCGPCIQSVPHLNKLQEQFASIAVLGVNAYDSREEVAWFCNKHGVQYSVLLNGRAVAEKFGVDGYPALFIIDKTGRIAYVHTGYDASAQAAIERVIKGLL